MLTFPFLCNCHSNGIQKKLNPVLKLLNQKVQSYRLRCKTSTNVFLEQITWKTNTFTFTILYITVWYTGWSSRKRPSPNCCHKVRSTESPRMSLYAVALRFPFTGTKGQCPNHEKQTQTIIPPPPNLTLCIGAGSVLLASVKPRFVRRTARW